MSLVTGVYGQTDNVRDLENKGQDDLVIPIFYMEKVLNKKRSDAAKRPVFDEYPAAKFIIPGDNTYEHKVRVTDDIFIDETGNQRVKWIARWNAFNEGREQINGMPLDSWYKIASHPGLIEEMRAMKIRSVEDLAALNDDFAGRVPWGRDWRGFARTEIESRKSTELLAENNKELEGKLAIEREARQALEARLAAMEAAMPKPTRKAG